MASFTKNTDYGLYIKLQEKSKLETINYIIEKIVENDYNENLVLFLYSYITNTILNSELDKYTDNFIYSQNKLTEKKKMNIRSKVSSIIQSELYSIKYDSKIEEYKNETQTIEDETINLLNAIFTKFHYFTFGKQVFEEGFKNYQKINKKKNSLFKWIYKIIAKVKDIVTRSKKYSLYSAYHYYHSKDDYLTYNGISLTTILDEANEKATKIIELVSEEIYYKKKNNKLLEKILNK